MNTKKLLASAFLALTLGLVACSKPSDDPKKDDDKKQEDTKDYETTHAFSAAAKDKYKAELTAGKFVVTCCGYEGMANAENWVLDFGFDTVKTVAEASATKIASDKLLDLTTIPSDYVVILGVGYTGKGLGSSTTTLEKELARADAIAELAKSKKIKGLVLVEVAGAANRGDNSDKLLGKIAPYADVIIAKSNANEGNFFTDIAKTYGCELFISDKSSELSKAFESLGFPTL